MWHRVLPVLGLFLALAGCNTLATPATDFSSSQTSDFGVRASYGPYHLRPSDQLHIQVYDDQNISGDYQIDSSGFISVPLAGRIKAGGLTPAQLEKALERRLADGVLKKPGVNVQVTGYGSVYVQGEVKRGGDFPYRPGLTVIDAIALAGGYTYRANESKVIIVRAGTAEERVYPMSRRIPVFPGDNILIPESFI